MTDHEVFPGTLDSSGAVRSLQFHGETQPAAVGGAEAKAGLLGEIFHLMHGLVMRIANDLLD